MRTLLATDGSECSGIAAQFLKRLALSSDDEIIILHVIRWVPFQDDRESHYKSLKKFKEDIGARILDSALDIIKSSQARISTALVEGYPDKAIVESVGESGADLVVTGARGLKGIKSLVIGSVTRSVAINSPKPVLVIKAPQKESSGKIKILYAADGSPSSSTTAHQLVSMPFPDDSELTVMNVGWSAISEIPERFVMEINDRIKEDVAKARTLEFDESRRILDQAKSVLSKKYRNINILTKIGDPATEILDEAEKLQSHIIAVGSRGLKGIKGMMGSVSRTILGHSKCSVFVGK